MKTKIFTSIFILSLLSACDLPSLPDYESVEIPLHIKGTVTDMADNSPVMKAFLSLYMRYKFTSSVHLCSAWTDKEGQYSLIYDYSNLGKMRINEKDLYIKVNASGYKIKEITYDDENHVRLTEEWQTIDIQLEAESGEVR